MLGATQFAFETPNVIDEGDAPPSPPLRTSFTFPTTTSLTVSSAPRHDSTNNQSNDHDTDTNHHESRESAKRLLNDIQDLELSQFSKPKLPRSQRLPFRDFPRHNESTNSDNGNGQHAKPYDPYDDDEEDEDDDDRRHLNNHHSLPHSAEDARLHAQMLLQQQQRNSKPASPLPPHVFGRTLQLSVPSSSSSRFSRHRRRDRRPNDKQRQYRSMHWEIRELASECLQRRGALRVTCALLLLIAIVVVCTMAAVTVHKNRNNNDAARNMDPIRFESIQQVLVDRGVSTMDDFNSKDSPQALALAWIVELDALQYDANHPRLVQRYVLAVFYFATGGGVVGTSRAPAQWHSPLQFVTNVDECAWNEVVTMPQYVTQTLVMGVSCNAQLQVTALFLPNYGVTGKLPSELAHLPSLKLLGLSDNAITGSLPDAFSNRLLDLVYVNLNNNTLTGTVPEYIGDWADLQVLGLGFNKLTGAIPVSMGTASKLKTLSLSHNALTGSLDFTRHLPNLQYFYVDHCAFSGKIDERFFSLLGNLREFDISNNKLTGDLPLNILFAEHQLHVLDVSNNNFTGTLPELTEYNYPLHFLSFRNNHFGGALPSALKKFNKLQHLDFANNLFTGTIPNDGLPGSLTYLSLSGNKFAVGDDTLPPMNQLVNLRELSLSGLGLTGAIPSWLVWCEELQVLDLSHNSLSGTVPSKIWSLPKLHTLILNDNDLSGRLPTSGGNHFGVLAIHHNDIEDSSFDAAVCHSNATAVGSQSVSADCNAGCGKECCARCCKDDSDSTCEAEILVEYQSGQNATAAPLSFDPDILDESGIFLSSLDLDESDP
jgi:Leucine-rich repeat (LRR) protein